MQRFRDGDRSRGGDSVAVSYREEGPWKELAADRILLSVGRRPDMTKVLAEDCRVELKHGRPIVKGDLPDNTGACVCHRRYGQRRVSPMWRRLYRPPT